MKSSQIYSILCLMYINYIQIIQTVIKYWVPYPNNNNNNNNGVLYLRIFPLTCYCDSTILITYYIFYFFGGHLQQFLLARVRSPVNMCVTFKRISIIVLNFFFYVQFISGGCRNMETWYYLGKLFYIIRVDVISTYFVYILSEIPNWSIWKKIYI